MNNLRHVFGLRKDPFPQDIPVKELFKLPALEPLEKRTMFAIEQKAISIITGDVGSGKSTSLRYVCSKCHPSEYQQISIVGGGYSLMELYRIILQSFGVDNHTYQVSRMVKNIRELVLEMASRKVTPLLIIDEAHLLKKNVFTELHTLIQFEYDSRPVMPMILCGQELLIDHLMMNSARPLASRVLGRNNLESIKKEVMDEYLKHQLKIAGASKNIISEEASFAIHQGSGGLLRSANFLAKTSMLAAAIDGCQTVSAEHVRIAANELFLQ